MRRPVKRHSTGDFGEGSQTPTRPLAYHGMTDSTRLGEHGRDYGPVAYQESSIPSKVRGTHPVWRCRKKGVYFGPDVRTYITDSISGSMIIGRNCEIRGTSRPCISSTWHNALYKTWHGIHLGTLRRRLLARDYLGFLARPEFGQDVGSLREEAG
jgi:hypothetical protein